MSAVPKTDALAKIRDAIAQARDLDMEIEDLENRLSDKKRELEKLLGDELPMLMIDKKVTRIDLDKSGNLPAYEAKLGPFYSANIPAGWDAERRTRAFEELEKFDAEDLIKVTVTFSFGRGERERALKLANANKKLMPQVAESVHHATLTSWVKNLVEDGKPTPPLEIIGATIGTKVKLKRSQD
jgi:hypothetical protein